MPVSDAWKITNDLLAELARSIGLPSLALDSDGFCAVEFDGKLTVAAFCDAAAESLLLTANLGEIPEKNSADLMATMLSANYAFGETGGIGTLALVPQASGQEAHEASMSFQVPLKGLDAGRLRNFYERFLNTSEAWSEYIAEFRHQTATGTGVAEERAIDRSLDAIRV